MREMEIIEQSLEFKLNALKETGVGVFQNLFQRGDIAFVVDSLTKILEGFDALTDALGLFGTALLGVGIVAFIKQFSQLKVLGLQGATSFDLVNAATARMKASDLAAILVKTNLTEAQQLEILSARGLGEAELAAARDTLNHANAQGVATASTGALTGATWSLGAALNGVKVAFMSNPLTAFVTVALTAIVAITRITSAIKQAKEEALQTAKDASGAYKDEVDSLGETKKRLDELAPRYQRLSQGVDSLNNNISLSISEHNEYLGICNELATMFPSLVQGYDEQGNAILSVKGNVDGLTQAYLDLVSAANSSVLVHGKTLFEDFKDQARSLTDSNLNGTKLTQSSVNSLRNILGSSNLDSAISKYAAEGSSSLIQITKALKDAGLKQSSSETSAEFLKRSLQENKGIAQAIISDFEAQMNDAITDLKPLSEAYISNLLLGDKFKGLSPDVKKQISSIVDNLDMTFYNQFDSVDAMYSRLGSMVDDYVGFYTSTQEEKLSKLELKFNSLASYKLSESELNVAYQLSLANEYETTQDLVDQIRGVADEVTEEVASSGVKFNFLELLSGEGFSDKVDSYITNVGKLQDALKKIKSGDFENSDFVELVKLFPELAYEADNLESGIISLLGSMKSGIVSDFSSQFGYMETDEDVQALQNFMDSVVELGEVVGDTSFAIDIDAEVDGVENLVSAIKQSVSSTGLNAEAISKLKERYKDLEGFRVDKLFERTANGIHLNTKELRELESAYEKQRKLDFSKTLVDLKKEYSELTREINKSTDASEKADLYKQRQSVLDRITDTANLATMYDGLTSAYKKWEDAQSIGEEGDMYDNLADKLGSIKELFDEGLIGTNKFRTAVQLMSNEDLSTANVDELISAYESGYETMTRYFQDGSEGCLNFLHDLQDLNSEWVHMNEDGSWEINFGLGNDQEIADALGINIESVQAILRKLSDYGFDINLDSLVDLNFDLATEDLDKLNAQIENAKELLRSLYEEDGTLKVDYSEEDVENAISTIEMLIYRKQSLDDAAILRVDTSTADSDITNIISKLQEFKASYNNLEVQTAIGADTTEAESTCNNLLSEISGMNAEILATLGIDTASIETLNASIGSITPELMVKAGLDASLIEEYQDAEHTTDGTVIWNNNIEQVTAWINQSHTARGEVKWYNNTVDVKTNFNAVGNITWRGSAKHMGTAFANGRWGTNTSGVALGGEIGQELLVRNGEFFTIGDHGAEMFQFKKGDIIFNHEQTRQIFANGRITSGKRRGYAFSSGSGKITGSGKVVTVPSGSSASRGSSSGGSSGSSGGSSGSSDAEDELKIIDWIEVAINRIEEAISRLKRTAESTYNTLKKRLGATADEITKINEELSIQQRGYDRYMQQANSVGLASELMQLVQNGTIDISEYDSETEELIRSYEEWCNKAVACSDAIEELHETLASLYEDRFNNVKDDFDNQLSLMEHMINSYNSGIDTLEEKGYMASTRYYVAIKNITEKNIGTMNAELNSLIKELNTAMLSGEIEEYSDAWYQMQDAINGVKEDVYDANIELIKLDKTIRDIAWERFDYVRDRISSIVDETEFLIDLVEDSDLYTDRGQFNDDGLTVLGLHAQNYNVYMSEADKYAKEILRISEEIANDPYDTELIKRREELLSLQQDSIKSAEDEKAAIVDMVENGIDIELSALKELIDAYKDSLDDAKDLYDYQSKLADKASEISSLQKQLSAYSGDNSLEARATSQKLRVDLQKAQEDLAKTQYEQFISDQKKLLDNLYTEYEEIINQRLDDVDALISDMIDVVNSNSELINDNLQNIASEVGYTLTPELQAIWDNSTDAVNGIITKYGDRFEEQNTAVKAVLDSIAANIASMVEISDKESQAIISGTTPSTSLNAGVHTTSNTGPSLKDSFRSSTNGVSSSSLDDETKRKVAAAIWHGYWGNDPERANRLTELFGSGNGIQALVNQGIGRNDFGNDIAEYSYEAMRKKIKGYRTGGLVDYTGLALVDGTPGKPELMLNSSDTENFLNLRDALRVLVSSDVIGRDFGYAPELKGIRKFAGAMSAQEFSRFGGNSIGNIEINIPIERVEDYNDFVTQLKNDPKFESMIASMTVGRLAGDSKLEKYRYNWK